MLPGESCRQGVITGVKAQSPRWVPARPEAWLLVTELGVHVCPGIQCVLCRARDAWKAHPEGHALYPCKAFLCPVTSLSLSFLIYSL